MKVVVAQAVALNGGDAAILFGLERVLREAFGDIEMTVFDRQAEIAQRLHPRIAFRRELYYQKQRAMGRALMLKALDGSPPGRAISRALLGGPTRTDLQTYANADLVVWTGGTYLVEHYDLTPKFFELDVLARLDVPLVLFTQSAGPFRDVQHRRRIAELGRRASLILTRDARTHEHFREAGVPADRLRVAPDGAFALQPPPRSENGGIFVSVRHWPYTDRAGETAERYVSAHALAITRLVKERGAPVTLLSTCQGVPEYWTNDAETASRIVSRIPAELRRQVRVDDRFHTPDQILAEYGGADLVIATRMHAAILGLVSGAPVLPVAYEFKTRELFGSFGQIDLVQDLETIEPEAFAAWALRGFDERRTLRDVQQAATRKLRAEVASLVDHFRGVDLAR